MRKHVMGFEPIRSGWKPEMLSTDITRASIEVTKPLVKSCGHLGLRPRTVSTYRRSSRPPRKDLRTEGLEPSHLIPKTSTLPLRHVLTAVP